MTPEEAKAALDEIRHGALAEIESAEDSARLRDLEIRFLGRKSRLAEILSGLGGQPPEVRREVGKAANETRAAITDAIGKRTELLAGGERAARLDVERLDVTLPGRRPSAGHLHPITQVVDEIIDVFVGLGFNAVEGPEAESEYYSFEALNMPADHPARSMWDTLYLEPNAHGQALLRPHTSPVQIRVMEATKPPVYVVVPGRTFRRDVADSTHLPVFSQVEGLAVDEGISFADLKGTLEAFAQALFGERLRVRMVPHYFPFTEPSAEVLVSCFVCDGTGVVDPRPKSGRGQGAGTIQCRTCRGEGWIEIMGAGMVHPNVFRAVGYDPEVTGFAFGMGAERIALLRYGVPDIRWFYESDMRFLESF
ncbi:MAG: phenylalanine--tRNA ligase subunit alpha [Actinomycetota bacterium]